MPIPIVNPYLWLLINIFFQIIKLKHVPNIFTAENKATDPESNLINQMPTMFFSSCISTFWNLIIRYKSNALIDNIIVNKNQNTMFFVVVILPIYMNKLFNYQSWQYFINPSH
jgi:hypothetical protein